MTVQLCSSAPDIYFILCASKPDNKYFVARLQPEDLQQPGVCCAALSVSQPGIWGSLPTHQDVYYSDEFC